MVIALGDKKRKLNVSKGITSGTNENETNMKSFLKGEIITGKSSDDHGETAYTATVIKKIAKTIILKLERYAEPIKFSLVTRDGEESAYWAGIVFTAGVKPSITFSWV